MLIKTIGILGGTGFVGRRLANRLVRQGYRLRVLTRDREKHKEDLILLPGLDLIETDAHDEPSLKKYLEGCDAIINLVGILNERGTDGSGFKVAHVDLTRKVLNTCQSLHIKRLLHMSALNADKNGRSHYLKTKGEAEDLVHDVKAIHTTSFRPSVIFGPEDSFFNRFAKLLKLIPGVFPLACPHTKFAPLYIDDLTAAMVSTLDNTDYYGRRLDLCGPEIYSLQELVRFTAECIGVKRIILSMPDFLSRIQAIEFDMAGFIFNALKIQKPFSTDNYLSLQTDSVSYQNALGEFNLNPMSIKTAVPGYLKNKSSKSNYTNYRQSSRRSG